MKNKLNFLSMAVLIAGLAIFSSCGGDDDGPTTADIVGTWTYQSADFDIKVNNQNFVTFLVQKMGFNAASAAVVEASLKSEIEDEELKGSTVTFNADGTLSSKSGDGSTGTGTYTLNSNKTQLTVTEDGETIVFNVKALTNNNLTIEYTEEEKEDFDEDGVDDTLIVKFTVTFTK